MNLYIIGAIIAGILIIGGIAVVSALSANVPAKEVNTNANTCGSNSDCPYNGNCNAERNCGNPTCESVKGTGRCSCRK